MQHTTLSAKPSHHSPPSSLHLKKKNQFLCFCLSPPTTRIIESGEGKLTSSYFSASYQNGPGTTGWESPSHPTVESTWPSVWPLQAKCLLGCPRWAQDVTAAFPAPTPSLLGDETAAGTKAAQSQIQMPSGYGGSSQACLGVFIDQCTQAGGEHCVFPGSMLTLSVMEDFLGRAS